MLWILSPLTVLIFGCCSGGILAFGLLPESELRDVITQQYAQLPAEQGEAVEQMMNMLFEVRSVLPVIAIIVFLLTVLPAIINIVLPFYISKGSRKATIASLVLTVMLTVIIGMLMLASILSPDMNLLILLLLTIGYVFTAVKLSRSLGEQAPPRESGEMGGEPWNRHL